MFRRALWTVNKQQWTFPDSENKQPKTHSWLLAVPAFSLNFELSPFDFQKLFCGKRTTLILNLN